jgi:hypothetical protein
MCCGQKRRALAGGAISYPRTAVQTQSSRPAESVPVSGESSMVSLLYTRQSPIQIRGTVSGQLYHFSSSAPVQAVDPRDLMALLRTRLFRQTRAA